MNHRENLDKAAYLRADVEIGGAVDGEDAEATGDAHQAARGLQSSETRSKTSRNGNKLDTGPFGKVQIV